ncbi:hypothetical protein N234_31630 [Ralstonia pickettii DTP0602]|nr:hypothetical protein N234_31630 [Ralstonia pickettii DTP0602]
MTVEASIFALLSPFVGGRVFPDTAPFDTPRPYVTYQQVGGEVITPLGGGIPDKQNGYFQVNVFAGSRASAAALALQIEGAFRTSTAFVAKPMAAPIADSEPDLVLYSTQQDFSVWSTR